MTFDQRVAEILVETGAYRDLEQPVILTSGNIGIYFINTENVLEDGGVWKEHANDSPGMWHHVNSLCRTSSNFNQVVQALARRVELAIPSKASREIAIAGGQRRDWPFSAAVAGHLELHHISLYKNGRVELISPMGEPTTRQELGVTIDRLKTGNRSRLDLSRYHALPVSDLQTSGSSSFDPRFGTGWFPMLWAAGATAYDAFTVVDRLQGAGEILHHAPIQGGKSSIRLDALVGITPEFLEKYSTNPERALAYHKNPHEWSEAYIHEHGIGPFVPAFDPNGRKLPRAGKFIGVFADVLSEDEAHLYRELQSKVKDRFDYDIAEREEMRLPSQARD